MASIPVNTACIDKLLQSCSWDNHLVEVAYVHDFGVFQYLCNTHPDMVNENLFDAAKFQLTKPEVVRFVLSWPHLRRQNIYLGVAKEYAKRACDKPTSNHMTHVDITPGEAREAFQAILAHGGGLDDLEDLWIMECVMPFIERDDVEVLRCFLAKPSVRKLTADKVAIFMFSCAISNGSLGCLEVIADRCVLSETTLERRTKVCSDKVTYKSLKVAVLRNASAKAFSYLASLPSFESLNDLEHLSPVELFRLAKNPAGLQIYPTLLDQPCFNVVNLIKPRMEKLALCNLKVFTALLDRFGAEVHPKPKAITKLFAAALSQGCLDVVKLLSERCGAMGASTWPRSWARDIQKTTMLRQVLCGDVSDDFMAYMTSEDMQRHIDVRGQLLEVLDADCGARVFEFACQRLHTLYFAPGAKEATPAEQQRVCKVLKDARRYKTLSFFKLAAEVASTWPQVFETTD